MMPHPLEIKSIAYPYLSYAKKENLIVNCAKMVLSPFAFTCYGKTVTSNIASPVDTGFLPE
jgi:hypothetical protein